MCVHVCIHIQTGCIWRIKGEQLGSTIRQKHAMVSAISSVAISSVASPSLSFIFILFLKNKFVVSQRIIDRFLYYCNNNNCVVPKTYTSISYSKTSYLNNRATAWLYVGAYREAILDCRKAMSVINPFLLFICILLLQSIEKTMILSYHYLLFFFFNF